MGDCCGWNENGVAMRELNDQLELPKNEVTSSCVIKFSKSSDAAPPERAILGVTMRTAADVTEIACSSREGCLWCGPFELRAVAFFCKNLLYSCFLVVINSWIPKCEGTWYKSQQNTFWKNLTLLFWIPEIFTNPGDWRIRLIFSLWRLSSRLMGCLNPLGRVQPKFTAGKSPRL